MSRSPVTASLSGVPEVDRMLTRLAKKDARRIARNAARAGASRTAKAIKSEVPIGEDKDLKRSVGWRHAKSRRTGEVMTKAGPNVGKKGDKQVKYAGALATPRGPRTRKEIGGQFAYLNPASEEQRTTDQANPDNFVQRAWSKAKGAVLSAMQQKVREGIARLRRGS